jgi:trafficking protein particle complex subunit 8
MLKNPLDVEVNLANLTVNVETTDAVNDIEIEVIDNILLHPKESRVVSSSFSLSLSLANYSCSA